MKIGICLFQIYEFRNIDHVRSFLLKVSCAKIAVIYTVSSKNHYIVISRFLFFIHVHTTQPACDESVHTAHAKNMTTRLKHICFNLLKTRRALVLFGKWIFNNHFCSWLNLKKNEYFSLHFFTFFYFCLLCIVCVINYWLNINMLKANV